MFYGVKIAISCLTVGYLYFTFKKDEKLYAEVLGVLWAIDTPFQSWEILLCIALMPINWALEALKWKYLASKVEEISFVNAFKGTLAGLGLGFITPQAVGDFAARIYFLTIKNKTEAIGAILLARLSMFFVAVFYGIVGFYILGNFEVLKASMFVDERVIWLVGISAFMILTMVVHFNVYAFIPFKYEHKKWVINLWNSFKILSQYSFNEFSTCLLLSVLRYLVFTFQYLLLLKFFGIDVYNILIVSAVWMIYFVKSIFPSFNFLNDLGVREVAAVYFLSELGVENADAILASLLLWFINIMVPTLAGTMILLLAKYKKL